MKTSLESNTTPNGLYLKPLKALQNQGFDLAVLLAMERDVLMRAHRSMALSGIVPTKANVIEAATRDLPRDARLLQSYTETSATLSSRPVRELETIASMLSRCAVNLEAAAVRHVAGDSGNLADRARAHHAIGERLADLLRGAHTLETSGMIAAPGHAQRLESVATFVQNGPLSKFLDKARALLSERDSDSESAPYRMAMA